ncbi:MAG: hypothetical protein IKU18_07050 [Bacteroidales bacterium]|nr:hypothetical protein [Bacteroidales bacterium]
MNSVKNKCSNVLALVLLLSSFVPLFFMDRLEGTRVPAHFNFAGIPNKWDNGTALMVLPFVACFVYVLLLLSQRWPHMINYPGRRRKGGVTTSSSTDGGSSKSMEQMHAVGVKYVSRISVVVMLLFSYLANSSLVIALGYWSKIPSGPMYAIIGLIVLLTVMFYRDVK